MEPAEKAISGQKKQKGERGCTAEDGVLPGKIYSSVDGARGGDAHGYAREVTLTGAYEENGLGGTGAINTGTSSPYAGTNCNYTMFLSWETVWGE